MSRSYRKQPYCPMCGCRNGRGKSLDQRRYRTAARVALKRGDQLPAVKTYLDPWGLPSDGWIFFGGLDPDLVAKLMRK